MPTTLRSLYEMFFRSRPTLTGVLTRGELGSVLFGRRDVLADDG